MSLGERLNNVPFGLVFEVKDLFYGWEWKSMEPSERSKIGKLFKEECRDRIECCGKTLQHQNLFIRVNE